METRLGFNMLRGVIITLVVSLVLLWPLLARGANNKTAQDVVKEQLPPQTATFGPSFWDRTMFIADINAFFTLSHLNKAGTLGGGQLNAVLAPVYRFNPKSYFILMYDGHYYRKRDFYSDEIGPKERKEFMAHTFQPMFRKDFGRHNAYSITPSVFYTATYNKDIDAARWQDGLYNYRDLGVSLQFDRRGFLDRLGKVSLTAQYYRRRYPNYASLLSLTGLDLRNPVTGQSEINVEKNEKDYHGILFKGNYLHLKPLGFSVKGQYSVLYKNLDDKKVVGSDGVLTSEGEKGYLNTLSVDTWYTFDIGGGLKVGLGLVGSFNRSNQNYYDAMQTLTLADDEFTPSYYDYNLYKLEPSLSYTLANYPLTLRVSYAYQKTLYRHRKAQYPNGVYKDEKQRDKEHDLSMGFQYEFSRNWSILGQWEYVSAESNNDDERVYRYDYTINNFSLGVSLRY